MGRVTESDCYLASPFLAPTQLANETRDTSGDTHVRAGRKPNDSETQMVEAVGIEP